MTDQTSVKQKIQTEAVDFRSPVSESIMKILAGSVNWCIDEDTNQDSEISSMQSQINTLISRVNNANHVLQEFIVVSQNISMAANQLFIGIIDTGVGDWSISLGPASILNLISSIVFIAGSGHIFLSGGSGGTPNFVGIRLTFQNV